MELLLGCGRMRDKRIHTPLGDDWKELVTLDNNQDVNPDVVFDLSSIGVMVGSAEDLHPIFPGIVGRIRMPFKDGEFDEIHAYEVLEHIGAQGDYKTFFAQFTEFHRILKPGGLLCATVPSWNGMWAWGDPSHTRIINLGTLVFLSQKEYLKQQGKTSMTDFRYIWKADFDIVMQDVKEESFAFVLKAVK